MIQNLKSTLSRNLTNAQGWRTNRKIIVIESDDWGSIRMPDNKTYNKLQNSRISNSLSLYDRLDSLEHRDDFQALLSIGSEFKDSRNKPLIFTLNTVMQNPDFPAIKASGFNDFIGVPFFQSYNQYYGEDLKDLWFKGIEENLIKPQFHAREHLNEHLWLKDLKLGNKDTQLGFEHDFFAVKTKTSSTLRNNYLATYFSETEKEFESVSSSTKDGLKMFKDIFGYNSETFIASNYCWPKELEELLNMNGVKGIQTQRGNTNTDYKNGKTSTKRFYTGQKNINNQTYLVRNVIFEPYSNQNKDWIDSSLKEIKNAFFWKKPAIICMHRINFASEMKINNRDDNLRHLKKMISELLKKFPNVEFMSSDQLIKLIENEISHP
jgi:hypothetical protein